MEINNSIILTQVLVPYQFTWEYKKSHQNLCYFPTPIDLLPILMTIITASLLSVINPFVDNINVRTTHNKKKWHFYTHISYCIVTYEQYKLKPKNFTISLSCQNVQVFLKPRSLCPIHYIDKVRKKVYFRWNTLTLQQWLFKLCMTCQTLK